MNRVALVSALDELSRLIEDFDELESDEQIMIAQSVVMTLNNEIEENINGKG